MQYSLREAIGTQDCKKLFQAVFINPLGRAGYVYQNFIEQINPKGTALLVEPIEFLKDTFSSTVDHIFESVSSKLNRDLPVFVIGFSAGGHIAAMIANRLQNYIQNTFLVLIDSFPFIEGFLDGFEERDVASLLFFNLWRSQNRPTPFSKDYLLNNFQVEGSFDTNTADFLLKNKIIEKTTEIEKINQELSKYFILLGMEKEVVIHSIESKAIIVTGREGRNWYPQFDIFFQDKFKKTPIFLNYPHNHQELVFSYELTFDLLNYMVALRHY